MGILSGFNYRQITKRLKSFGFIFVRQSSGSHEIWYNDKTNRCTTISRHSGDIPEGTLRAILKQAKINPKDFVRK